MEYLITAAIVLFAALVKGSTGFGFSMSALPLLALQYSVKTAVPIITFWSLATSVIIILQKKEFKISKEKNAVILWGGLGTIIGTIFLANINERILVLIIALIFAVLTTLSLTGVQLKVKRLKRATIRTGLLSGILAGSVSISGPPITLFLNAIDTTKEEFREIFARFDIFTSSIALMGFYFAGFIQPGMLKSGLLFVPIIFLGSYLGKRINLFIPAHTFRKINLALSLISCIVLVIKFL